jgi:hypothetical protein
MDDSQIEEIMKEAFHRMHKYTCAEASLQCLQTLWDMPKDGYSWADAGYLGAIMTGKTTCGILIGSSIGIGLRCGRGLKGTPEEHKTERGSAIQGVGELYKEFLEKFGSTDYKTLSNCDFSNPDDVGKYLSTKAWKKTCDIYLKFAIQKCRDMVEEGII